MLPSRLFRSRWAALFWAAGVVWTAYDIAAAMPGKPAPAQPAAKPAAHTDVVGDPIDPAATATLANAAGW